MLIFQANGLRNKISMKGREQMKKSNRVFAAFFAALLLAGVFSGCDGNNYNISDKSSGVQTVATESSDINIPGYETLEFKAGKTKQSSSFHNPDDNSCYFRMSLLTDDETIWQSDYIKPGESIRKIKLSRSFDAGDYEAKLKYECFTLQDKAPLNGAEIEVALHVE